MKTDKTDTAGNHPKAENAEKLAKIERRLRTNFRKLTPEAQEDDHVGLTLDLIDARVAYKKQESEIRRLKEMVKSFKGDQAEVIRRQAQTIRHKESEMYRANDKAAAALRQVYVLKKRVKELEAMGIDV